MREGDRELSTTAAMFYLRHEIEKLLFGLTSWRRGGLA
jgi:hypothetical protein